MSHKAAMTVHRRRAEVQQLWESEGRLPDQAGDATVTFVEAPGDRGTEIHVALGSGGSLLGRLTGGPPLAKVKDELRRFKQRLETGEVPRSEGTPEGERLARKLKQRPAQPLDESELEQAGAR
jgi:hypothetical protein